MILWEKAVYDRLKSFAHAESGLNVKQAKELLCAAWNARQVEFLTDDGEPVHGRTLLGNVLREPFTVRINFEYQCQPLADSPSPERAVVEAASPTEVGSDDAARSHPASTTEAAPTRAADPLIERVIRSLDAQERRRDFVWAGFVVKELIPGLGIEQREARVLFDRLVDSGIILLQKLPNPNNPDFMTTCVKLDRRNRLVQNLLNGDTGRGAEFRPVSIHGEPASATLIRDRR